MDSAGETRSLFVKGADVADVQRVVYLFGAGASHACVKAVNGRWGILTSDLVDDLLKSVSALVKRDYGGEPRLHELANAVITKASDIEHVITFLDESVSDLHRGFAEKLKKAFEDVLSKRLRSLRQDHDGLPVGLYEALLDMHTIEEFGEELVGMLSLNYDEFVETVIEETFERRVDFGIAVAGGADHEEKAPQLLKLHGSFGWKDAWPIERRSDGESLWIPPGIQKAKDRHPFNLLWGLAREMLDCDVLRVIGCRLSPNDWDLISLLFTTRHTKEPPSTYRIEVIGPPSSVHKPSHDKWDKWPNHKSLQKDYPYLEIRSILEVEDIGKQLIGDQLGGKPREFRTLTEEERDKLLGEMDENWFRLWLMHKAKDIRAKGGSVKGHVGAFERLMLEA